MPVNTRGYQLLIGFAMLLMSIGIACNGGAAPVAQPAQQPTPVPSNSNTNNSSPAANGSAPVIFIDRNKFFQIEVPGDWKHSTNSGPHAYLDQFLSPDGKAMVENITYNDGTPFKGAQNGQFALLLIRQFHSNGKEGDLRVSEDKIMTDGTERLTWSSNGRGFSGLSYFKVRDGVNFLMFSLESADDHQIAYLEVLNKIQASYSTP